MKKKLINHPYGLLEKYAELIGKGCSFEFARYRYVKGQIKDERKIIKIEYNEIKENIFELFIKEKNLGIEWALQSRVYDNENNIKHIPMIDLSGKVTENEMYEIAIALKDLEIYKIAIYESGKSYHVYGIDKLLHENEFYKFCGRILLLNKPGAHQIIDARWVGHRILAGYFSLRWTNSAKNYFRHPILEKIIEMKNDNKNNENNIIKKYNIKKINKDENQNKIDRRGKQVNLF
jgi:hypothetical protein